MRKIAVTNLKGGTGKTTTATNVAAGLAMNGHNVLLIDFDSQAAATMGLGIDPYTLPNGSIYDVLMTPKPIIDILVQPIKDVNTLWLAPSHEDLSGAEAELINKLSRELILTNKLENISNFDYIIIDTGPTPGVLFFNAVFAVDEVIVPVNPEYYSLVGTKTHMKMLQMVHDATNMNHTVTILFTKYRTRLKEHEQGILDVKERFPGGMDPVFGIEINTFETVIPQNTDVSKSPASGLPAILAYPDSFGAIAYSKLVNEIEAKS